MACGQWLKPINTTRNKTEDEVVEPLSPASRLFHAPQLNCCIIAMVGCKTMINVEVIKDGINQTMVKHPRISSKLVFHPKKHGKPVGWIRTKVNVDDHVIVPNLHSHINSPDKFVEDYVTNLTQTPMDLTKPLWEIHILNIKTKDANSIAIFRIHHSIGDGVSLMSLVLACTRKTSDPNAVPTFPTEDKKKKKLFENSSSFWLLSCFLWLWFALKMLWNTIVDLCFFLATMIFLKDTNTPVKASRGTEKGPKKFVYRILSLDDIKLVKNVMNVTINDVIVGITQAGLSRYLNRKYGESKGDQNVQQNHLPQHIRLRSTLLVNIRPTSKIQDLAEQMESNDPKRKWEWGNSIGYILLPFDIALRDDPLDYIRKAKTTIDKKKQSLEAVFTFICAEFILKALGLGVTATITHRALSNATLSFSNVVGPKEEISFYGHPMTFLAPSVYGHPHALTVHFQSYMDQMTLVLAVDQNVIPEPHRLCDDIEEFLAFAKEAAQKKKIFHI
ncbi:wax ester synthase/diacylglycerol acyltransferase 5 isoform X1 [Beta vulgaris subsp. vulgaris]|uniref:wax ester synthase/diacylglycerol acyltransferase 5 isoform X1 n=2 Tax=Beta vulgaris subsp. vulgaris TaxID=3555 RepID=UPI002036F581|nr:wax ester synthase/diacylglycerol acyltransferase 5 isoform X1 [Beta vulgaris subsp. vulgaris]